MYRPREPRRLGSLGNTVGHWPIFTTLHSTLCAFVVLVQFLRFIGVRGWVIVFDEYVAAFMFINNLSSDQWISLP